MTSGYCALCGKPGTGLDPLDKHHIFGGSNRRNSERYGLVVPLHHYECHIFGEKAAHNCRESMDKLHVMGQRMAMEQQGWTKEEFRRIFGRSYL